MTTRRSGDVLTPRVVVLNATFWLLGLIVLPMSNLSWQGGLPHREVARGVAVTAAGAESPCPVLALSPAPGAGPLFQRAQKNFSAGTAWPYRRPGVPDVWLTWVRDNLGWHMFRYMPCLATLGEAFWRAGANVALTQNARNGNLDTMLEDLAAARKIGKSPIVILVGICQPDCDLMVEFGSNVSDTGATLIVYNSEPYYRRKIGFFAEVMEAVNASKASEIWDYSKSNMALYTKRAQSFSTRNITARYFPPGAAELLDVGADFDSPDREEYSIAFLGERQPGQGFGKKQSFWNRTFRGLSQKLAKDKAGGYEGGVKDWGNLKNYTSRYPMQINYHRAIGPSEMRAHKQWCEAVGCCGAAQGPSGEGCPSQDPAEAFRLSQVAANGGCIVSERSFSGDEEAWDGIVHFTDKQRLDSTFAELGKDLRRCQTETKALFQRRFNVSRLLSETKFLQDWIAAGHSCFTPG